MAEQKALARQRLQRPVRRGEAVTNSCEKLQRRDQQLVRFSFLVYFLHLLVAIAINNHNNNVM